MSRKWIFVIVLTKCWLGYVVTEGSASNTRDTGQYDIAGIDKDGDKPPTMAVKEDNRLHDVSRSKDASHYRGKYQGQCRGKGTYYRDKYSFVICQHRIRYIQKCPDGTMNKDLDEFKAITFYDISPFCSINLNDVGYTLTAKTRVGPTQRQPPPTPKIIAYLPDFMKKKQKQILKQKPSVAQKGNFPKGGTPVEGKSLKLKHLQFAEPISMPPRVGRSLAKRSPRRNLNYPNKKYGEGININPYKNKSAFNSRSILQEEDVGSYEDGSHEDEQPSDYDGGDNENYSNEYSSDEYTEDPIANPFPDAAYTTSSENRRSPRVETVNDLKGTRSKGSAVHAKQTFNTKEPRDRLPVDDHMDNHRVRHVVKRSNRYNRYTEASTDSFPYTSKYSSSYKAPKSNSAGNYHHKPISYDMNYYKGSQPLRKSPTKKPFSRKSKTKYREVEPRKWSDGYSKGSYSPEYYPGSAIKGGPYDSGSQYKKYSRGQYSSRDFSSPYQSGPFMKGEPELNPFEKSIFGEAKFFKGSSFKYSVPKQDNEYYPEMPIDMSNKHQSENTYQYPNSKYGMDKYIKRKYSYIEPNQEGNSLSGGRTGPRVQSSAYDNTFGTSFDRTPTPTANYDDPLTYYKKQQDEKSEPTENGDWQEWLTDLSDVEPSYKNTDSQLFDNSDHGNTYNAYPEQDNAEANPSFSALFENPRSEDGGYPGPFENAFDRSDTKQSEPKKSREEWANWLTDLSDMDNKYADSYDGARAPFESGLGMQKTTRQDAKSGRVSRGSSCGMEHLNNNGFDGSSGDNRSALPRLPAIQESKTDWTKWLTDLSDIAPQQYKIPEQALSENAKEQELVKANVNSIAQATDKKRDFMAYSSRDRTPSLDQKTIGSGFEYANLDKPNLSNGDEPEYNPMKWDKWLQDSSDFKPMVKRNEDIDKNRGPQKIFTWQDVISGQIGKSVNSQPPTERSANGQSRSKKKSNTLLGNEQWQIELDSGQGQNPMYTNTNRISSKLQPYSIGGSRVGSNTANAGKAVGRPQSTLKRNLIVNRGPRASLPLPRDKDPLSSNSAEFLTKLSQTLNSYAGQTQTRLPYVEYVGQSPNHVGGEPRTKALRLHGAKQFTDPIPTNRFIKADAGGSVQRVVRPFFGKLRTLVTTPAYDKSDIVTSPKIVLTAV